MPRNLHLTTNRLALILLFGAVVCIAAFYSIELPYLNNVVEEHHYILVSLNIWIHHQWIVLTDSKGIYLNKPPLTFWLTNLVWQITGLNNGVFRALPAAAVVGTLWFTTQIFKQLWPTYRDRAWMAAAVLLGIFEFMRSVPLYTHDLLLFFFVTLALYGLIRAANPNQRFGWFIWGIAIGLGTLTKGPIIFVFALPPALLGCIWLKPTHQSKQHWFGGLLLGLLLSLLIIAAWLIPLTDQLGYAYIKQLLLDRIFGLHQFYSYQASRPWWIYCQLLPMNLLPWTLWPLLYLALGRHIKQIYADSSYDPASRWLACSILVIFIIMTLIESKASRYIMPILLYISLFITVSLNQYSQQKSLSSLYTNWPLLIGLAISSIAILIITPEHSTQLFKHTHYAHLLKQFVPGLLIAATLILIASLWALIQRPRQLSTAIVSQLLLMLLLLFCYSHFFLRTKMNLYGYAAFETCVNQHYQAANQPPLAYGYRYGGYYYRVGNQALPWGLQFYNRAELDTWIKKNPQGVVIEEVATTKPLKQPPLCQSIPIDNKYLIYSNNYI